MPKGQYLNRYRQPKEVRAKLLGVTLLQPGEVSLTLRVRANREVMAQFLALTPGERGNVVRLGLEARAEARTKGE
jgi:hypothetical protein